ncbi:arsenate reductase/protein-tyrosine-phosphatase family protein [Blastococcus sp. SYSU D01042]
MTGVPAPSDGDGTPTGVSVLVVCTANICRSPVGERLLASRLGGSGVTVSSAGTLALVGRPVDPPMAGLLADAGVPAQPFAARQVRADLLRDAGLVLTMTREHRAAVVAAAPATVRRTFLLTEAAAIAEAVADAGWPAEVAEGPAARLAALPSLAGPHRVPGGSGADVPDPYRRPAEDYLACFALIEAAVDRLVRAVS